MPQAGEENPCYTLLVCGSSETVIQETPKPTAARRAFHFALGLTVLLGGYSALLLAIRLVVL